MRFACSCTANHQEFEEKSERMEPNSRKTHSERKICWKMEIREHHNYKEKQTQADTELWVTTITDNSCRVAYHIPSRSKGLYLHQQLSIESSVREVY